MVGHRLGTPFEPPLLGRVDAVPLHELCTKSANAACLEAAWASAAWALRRHRPCRCRCDPRRSERVVGLRGLIEQTWQRYGLLVAITESHLGSHRQDQARWFIDAWRIANDLRSEGVDVRAVTAWSLLGAFDWNQMVTRSAGHYETGVFDVRHDQPRPTLMVSALKDLSSDRVPSGPGLETRGWWCADRQSPRLGMHGRAAPRPILILGDAGPLAMLAALACEQRGLPHRIGHELHEAAILDARPCAVLDVRTGPQAKVDHVARACSSFSISDARLIDDHAPQASEPTGLSSPGSGRSSPLWATILGRSACWLPCMRANRCVRARMYAGWDAIVRR